MAGITKVIFIIIMLSISGCYSVEQDRNDLIESVRSVGLNSFNFGYTCGSEGKSYEEARKVYMQIMDESYKEALTVKEWQE